MQSYGDYQGAFQLGYNHSLNQSCRDFCTSKSIHCILYARYRIPVSYGIAGKTCIVYANSHFPSFLADEQDGVIVFRCTGLYPAFL